MSKTERKEVYVDISARHVHLTRADQDVLFGEGYELTPKKTLYGTGGMAFASEEQIAVVGPRGRFDKVRILGPCRSATQIELSKTDARTLGVDAPVRLSGDVKGSAPIKLIGPKGELEVKEGAIIAKRHLHLTRDKGEEWGLKHGDSVWVRIDTEDRSIIFGDTEVRMMGGEKLAFVHIDTDEANAAGMPSAMNGYLVEVGPVE